MDARSPSFGKDYGDDAIVDDNSRAQSINIITSLEDDSIH